MKLYIDIETKCDLKLDMVGAPRYAADTSCGINCIQWQVDDQPMRLFDGNALVFTELRDTIRTATTLVAHNAEFEMEILDKVLGITTPVEQWSDTMARCAYYGYPLSLDEAGKALGTTVLKDIGAKPTMLKLATGQFTPQTNPEDFKRLYAYCAGDVEVMRQIDKLVPELPHQVRQVWNLTTTINRRGVPVDMNAVNNALKLKDEIKDDYDQKMRNLTTGVVQSVGQVGKIQAFLNDTCNLNLPDLTADTVDKHLSSLAPDSRAGQILQIRQEAGLSSIGKYEKIKAYQIDSRLHQMHFFYGAHTGRPTGRGPQCLNYPRDERPGTWADMLSKAPELLRYMSKPAEKLKGALRGTIAAPEGKWLIGFDASQSEARGTFWLAGCEDGLDLFRTTDPYCTYGRSLFGREITKANDPEERNAAKAAVLAFGFVGGIGAGQRIGVNYHFDYHSMADLILPTSSPFELGEARRLYDYYIAGSPHKPLSEREGMAVDILKQRYRRSFPRVVQYWDELEAAFKFGGRAGRIFVEVKPSGLRILTLPSGRQMFYHDVRISDDGKKYTYRARKGRESLWKGQLIENVAQALSEDVNNWYRLQADKIMPLIHQCYDECTGEVDYEEKDRIKAEVEKMTKELRPDWCEGLPLDFSFWDGERYGH